MVRASLRPLLGLATIAVIVGIVAVAVALFQDRFARTVPLTVLSQRAGLVMNPDAKVKLLGVQVGRVAAIEDRPNGQAALHLAVDPAQLSQIPENVVVDITANTVFGAKSVDMRPPENPSPRALQPGDVLDARQVTVELNTLFEQLSEVLSKIQPEKLNETLGAISSALDGRGEKFGQTLSDLNTLLATVEPSYPNLSHELEVAPLAINAYADAAPDLVRTVHSATQISQTLVDEQQNLDAFLVSSIGLGDIGNDVLGSNRQALADVLDLLVPTTDLAARYHEALFCGIKGLGVLGSGPTLDKPGVVISNGLLLGRERYRYPHNLPKVAATGGPQCTNLPAVPFNTRPPFVVADVGTNQSEYGNEGILLNSDGLKQLLFGPIDGPPRNSGQIGMPG